MYAEHTLYQDKLEWKKTIVDARLMEKTSTIVDMLVTPQSIRKVGNEEDMKVKGEGEYRGL